MRTATKVYGTLILLLAAGFAGGKDAPKAPVDVEASIGRGIDYLVGKQNENGSWGAPTRTKGLNIYAPVPGAHRAFRAAVTAMAVSALIETKADKRSPEASAALDKGQAWLLEHLPKLRRADGTAIYNVWGHAFGIQALCLIHERSANDPALQKTLRSLIDQQIERLRQYESVDGGWGYYDFRVGSNRPASSSISFVNATVLIVFDQARKIGVEIPEDLSQRAINATVRQRKKDFSYLYGEYLKMRPMRGINRPGGSLGRSQVCNLALRRWGDEQITDEVLRTWLDRLVTRNGWLSIGRKRPVPHESWFQVAGYFYYYGHYYAALCLEELEDTGKYQSDLARILVPLQEKDGSWWDYPLYDYHQPYGTAFALMTLARCRQF